MLVKPKCILLVFGEGGHNTQMLRLCERLNLKTIIDESDGDTVLALTDSEASQLPNIVTKKIVLPAIRDKHEKVSLTKISVALSRNLMTLYRVFSQYDVRILISTGPGIAVPAALLCRLFRAQVIHIETWSRFFSQSMAGRFMYRLAQHFYVQNQEQLTVYPKARWSGRL